jgi:DNA-binding Lrp family transcriptional regulator
VAVTDPVDARLLAALAELGKAAVHELAAKVGMDPREVAYRLVGLSGSGLPLLVGVESDPHGLRAALAAGAGGAQGAPSGAYQVPNPAQGLPSGAYQVPNPAQGPPSGAYQVQNPAQGPPSARYVVPPSPNGGYAHGPQRPPGPALPPRTPQPPSPTPPADPVMSTWGPPQSSSWARGDRQQPGPTPPAARTGRTGDVLQTQGLEGEQLAIQLLEVQDPADYLFSAAGYRLEDDERAVVVHTEITNRGPIPFVSLPDNYLELLTTDGRAIAKAPVSLSSRPPHRIGVRPGETLGGHTVYQLPESTRIVAVRWSPRPEPDERSLTWSTED